jgi:transcriptional regulator with PAS, ATPase and Fis domain
MPEPSTRVRAPSRVVRYGKVRITVDKGPSRGARLEVAEHLVRVGTENDNDLVLKDDTVSRHHCEIEPVVGGVRIRDAGSTNGITIAGLRVYDAIVPGSARLVLGESELAIEPLEEFVEREQIAGNRFGDLLGDSPHMRELFADLERISAVDATLLVEGETGVGKDLVAESVHRTSPRADEPFVVFDCGAVAATLLESELFGHERGAFTGAIVAREGVFEQAQGGTLFLDEIGELPRELQPKLLRALERREIRRVGGNRTIKIDVRVIAATNRSLRAEVERGTFRDDLYYRLAVAHVVVPPLRERMEDLAPLVEHFLGLERPPRSASDIPEAIWTMFRAHRWPGNVRELRNAVERLLVTPERPLAGPGSRTSTMPPPTEVVAPLQVARREASDAFERAYLTTVFQRAEGSIIRAAAIAEVSRQMLQKLLKKHGRDSS